MGITANDVCDLIDDAMAEGLSYDDLVVISGHIKFLADECKARNQRAMRHKLGPTTRVRISEHSDLRPRYVLGVEAVVMKVNKKTANIKLGDVPPAPGGGQGRFYTGQIIRCPLDCLEIIEGGF